MFMDKLLWWLIAGSTGGLNRAKIIKALHDRPYNINQLSETLNLNYKTVQHHIKVLEENKVITFTGKQKYGKMYYLSNKMEENYDTFKDICKEGKISI